MWIQQWIISEQTCGGEQVGLAEVNCHSRGQNFGVRLCRSRQLPGTQLCANPWWKDQFSFGWDPQALRQKRWTSAFCLSPSFSSEMIEFQVKNKTNANQKGSQSEAGGDQEKQLLIPSYNADLVEASVWPKLVLLSLKFYKQLLSFLPISAWSKCLLARRRRGEKSHKGLDLNRSSREQQTNDSSFNINSPQWKQFGPK